MHHQKDNGDKGIKSSGKVKGKHKLDRRTRRSRNPDSMKRTRCQKGPAKRCAPLRSYGIVRLRTDFTILKCYQAQRKIGGQKETHRVPLRSIPDQQLGRTQPNRVTSDHLLCC